MTKEKKFTDIEITFCDKKCHFNRVANKELVTFSENAEKEYEKIIKVWQDKSNDLILKSDELQQKIARKEKKMGLLEAMEDKNIEELLKLNDELEKLELDAQKLAKTITQHQENTPIKKYNDILEQTLAEKAEIFLDNVTAEDYLENGTLTDTCIARNLEIYYQMAMVGMKKANIKVEMEKHMKQFLREQQDAREQL